MSKHKILVIDRGLNLHLARKIGESEAKVWYCMEDKSPFPESPKIQIGRNLEEVERVISPWEYIDKADAIYFFDTYDGKFQKWLSDNDYRVFGCGLSEKIELDRVFFYETLSKLGMPVTGTYIAEGLDDLCGYLKGKTDKWLKTSYHRGDFETHHYTNMRQLGPWIDDLRCRLGSRADKIEVLVQNPIKTECEAGWDGFCVDGKFNQNGLVGYEVKDRGYICKVVKDPPKILKDVNDKMGPVLKSLGMKGHWSTEVRITDSGKAYFTDPTTRAPSPPSELMCEMYEDYAGIIWDISGDVMPTPKVKAPYGAELILKSGWHAKHELIVEFPESISPFVKLKNATKVGSAYSCIPNENEGYFGAVIAYGNSMEEAIKTCMDRAEMIEADELKIDDEIFSEASCTVAAGKKFGINV